MIAILLGAQILLEPLGVPESVRFSRMTPEESREFFREHARSSLEKQLTAAGHTLVSTGADVTLSVDFRSVKWRNRSRREILDRPAEAGSMTEVELEFAWKTANGGIPRQRLKASAKGPYFGTTDWNELRGSPQDKALVIRVVAKQQAEAAGRAAFEAIKTKFPVPAPQ